MTNLSLQFQKQAIVEYAAKYDFNIVGEFVRMLEFIEANKGNVSHILVYTLDRFSRTGGKAIELTMGLREKSGITGSRSPNRPTRPTRAGCFCRTSYSFSQSSTTSFVARGSSLA
jgi:hypothetical protein